MTGWLLSYIVRLFRAVSLPRDSDRIDFCVDRSCSMGCGTADPWISEGRPIGSRPVYPVTSSTRMSHMASS